MWIRGGTMAAVDISYSAVVCGMLWVLRFGVRVSSIHSCLKAGDVG